MSYATPGMVSNNWGTHVAFANQAGADVGPSPWDEALKQSQQNMQTAQKASLQIPQLQQNLQQSINSYPAFENEFGLGGPPIGGQARQSAQPTPSVASRGFNPWSLQGEALA